MRDSETKIVDELISVKGIKAIGNKLSSFKIKNINQLEPIGYTPPEKKEINDKMAQELLQKDVSIKMLKI